MESWYLSITSFQVIFTDFEPNFKRTNKTLVVHLEVDLFPVAFGN